MSKPIEMVCEMCSEPITDDRNYFVVYEGFHMGMLVEVGCMHVCPYLPGNPPLAFISSVGCMQRYVSFWLGSLESRRSCH